MKQTLSQIVGSFYSLGFTRKPMNSFASEITAGERIRIEGQVFDGDGNLVFDALIEIWQANAYGCYNYSEDKQERLFDPQFIGWGCAGMDANGSYWFETIKPGTVPGSEGWVQALHANLSMRSSVSCILN